MWAGIGVVTQFTVLSLAAGLAPLPYFSSLHVTFLLPPPGRPPDLHYFTAPEDL